MGKVPKNVELWKYTWDMLMNDKRLRKALTGGADEQEINVCLPRKNSIQSYRGTIYISDPKSDTSQGHFIAYQMNKDFINIFDPAPPNGTYGAWANKKVIDEIKKRTGKLVRINASHTQQHEEDSFCQTWSLAWLIPSLKHYTRNVSSGTQGIRNMYSIVQKIMASKPFKAFITKHAQSIQREIILPGIRQFKIKQPAFVDVEGFIRFINKERFRKIFED